MLVSPSKEGTGLIGAAGAITQFLRLTFLRPIERFLAQVISVSTEPTAFVRERIHLGDTTNFLRAAGFFVSAISTAFLAEVATLYLLGIGNLTEPYYWLFILLTSIPFVVVCSLLVYKADNQVTPHSLAHRAPSPACCVQQSSFLRHQLVCHHARAQAPLPKLGCPRSKYGTSIRP